MKHPTGTFKRTIRYKSGKRVRQVVAPTGRVLETVKLGNKTRRTKAGRRLAKRLRRIRR